MRQLKKELGMKPYGVMDAYSQTLLPPEVSGRFNSRERESLDVQWCKLQATWQQLGSGSKPWTSCHIISSSPLITPDSSSLSNRVAH